jgi:hypothetical protein
MITPDISGLYHIKTKIEGELIMSTATNTIDRKALVTACKVTTGLGIISYAFLTEPRAEEEGKPAKYSTSFLIPKSDTKTLTRIKAVINAAAQLGQVDKWNGKIPNPLKHPLRDGDAEADEKGAEYAGHYFLNATSARKPRIVDFQIQDILDPDEIYSGCKCRLSLNFYAFNSNGNKSVACGLNNVQKIEDGDPWAAQEPKPRTISRILAILICRSANRTLRRPPLPLPPPLNRPATISSTASTSQAMRHNQRYKHRTAWGISPRRFFASFIVNIRKKARYKVFRQHWRHRRLFEIVDIPRYDMFSLYPFGANSGEGVLKIPHLFVHRAEQVVFPYVSHLKHSK